MQHGALVTRQGHTHHSDHFLNSKGNMVMNKRQRHATLAFLKIDRRHGHPRQGPHPYLLHHLHPPNPDIQTYIYICVCVSNGGTSCQNVDGRSMAPLKLILTIFVGLLSVVIGMYLTLY